MRHTSATFLIGQGMDIETIASRLGHSTSATTTNVYSHFLKAKDREAADMMEETFSLNKIPPEKEAKKGAK
ncbi:MAG: tyrosine-type recombinase/integrase [Desulfosporosinus sp.]